MRYQVSPRWYRLLSFAARQNGAFTLEQAKIAGYNAQRIQDYITEGRMVRLRRGIYGFTYLLEEEKLDFVLIALWAHKRCIFSRRSAAFLHGMLRERPEEYDIIVPHGLVFDERKVGREGSVRLWHGQIPMRERFLYKNVFATAPLRTLEDLAEDVTEGRIPPETLREAAQRALNKKLVGPREIRVVRIALRPYGGVHPPDERSPETQNA